MSEARHAAWANFLFRPYLRGLLRRSFHGLRLIGEVPDPLPDLPLLLIGNHNTWWDGFFPWFLNTALFRRKFHILMLEEQLSRYPFFRLLGAFGIRQGHPRNVMETLRYAASLLKRADTLLCFFPQGALIPYGTRPLGFRRGLERVLSIHGGPVTLVQLAMRCEFLGSRLPEAFFLFSRARTVCSRDFGGAAEAERDQEELMERLEAEITRGTAGRLLLGSSRSE